MATNINYFKIDNVVFEGLIGYELLKTTNQLNYPVSPGRQTDGSMRNINDYEAFIIPKVEIGFKFINNNQYHILRDILMSKRTFQITYYDNDFGKLVQHQMYAEPADLTNFTSLGQEILGIKDFKIAFVGTLNETTEYTATFVGSATTTSTARWGRAVTVPIGTWRKTSSDSSGIYYYGGDKMILFENVTLTSVNT